MQEILSTVTALFSTEAARAVLLSPLSVCSVFAYPNSCIYDCLCLGCLTWVQMLMRAIASGGCTDTVRQSALEADSERKVS